MSSNLRRRHSRPQRLCTGLHAAILFAFVPLFVSCEMREQPDATLARADSLVMASATRLSAGGSESAIDTVALRIPASSRRLSPLADSIGARMVFLTYGQRGHVAASRDGRLLLDLGRIDHGIGSDAERAAFLEAASATAPVRIGERFRLYTPWGAEDVGVSAFEVWSGRIVAVLHGSARIEAAAADTAPLTALAVRHGADAAQDDTTPCDRSAGNAPARLRLVRDSLSSALRRDTVMLHPAQRRTVRVRTSHAVGCFAGARALLVATLVAGDHDHVRQAVVLLDSEGGVLPLMLLDPRFRSHEVLHALDADGDGVDDIAVRGRARGVAGTVVLRLDSHMQRLEWLATGFSWESM